ncbi:glycosyltransferase family 2 protein [Thiothrix subterranea]|uniref:Glycosyltransferase family 2 protein n=1 Tax=Thiothrix subterranea TaxID=2735563 RepID=A0AA51MMQ4_9GAMM|nr:glycosyltransferase family 2 protein [Thiothrix subterranea]MDQ5768769.1 glycosyltransferase family 2 protein [Thiothrix subterranea]WML86549.1 glycosyltransferase family 2 protein [Thiothrix subterranea]
MKVSGCTFIRNAQILGYPFIESIRSILPIVDEFVIVVGQSEDDTLQILRDLHEPKIRIIETVWNDHMRVKGYVYGQQKMIAQFACTGDWIFYLEADEVVHENDLPRIQASMQQHLHDERVEALIFDYLHFYGNANTYLWSPGWYRRAPRIIKASVRSYAPDGLFWLVLASNKHGRYPNAAHTGATTYHYGWIRSEAQMNLKASWVEKYWNKRNAAIDYREMDARILREFNGTHPAVVQDWLPAAAGLFQTNPAYRPTRKQQKHWWMLHLERWFGLELSKKHYRLIHPAKR